MIEQNAIIFCPFCEEKVLTSITGRCVWCSIKLIKWCHKGHLVMGDNAYIKRAHKRSIECRICNNERSRDRKRREAARASSYAR